MGVPATTDKRFRRAHVSPARRRGRFHIPRKRIVQVALLAAVVLYTGYRTAAAVVGSEALAIARIRINGNTRLSREDVLALLEGLEGRHILLVSLEEWRQRLLASPWIEDAALRRVLPRTVDVLIAERQPMAIGRRGSDLFLVDHHGDIIDAFGPSHAEFDLPVIDGLASETAATGTPPAVDAGRAALAMRLLASLKERPDLAGRVSQIDVTDIRDAVVILKGDTALIRVGEDQFVERLQSYLDLAPALRQKIPQIDYIDLRFGERVYVRPQASGPRPQKAAGGG